MSSASCVCLRMLSVAHRFRRSFMHVRNPLPRAMRTSWLGALALVLIPAAAHAVDPFHAPPQSSGSLQVKLYPTEVVATGVAKRVTFGVPFTRGSLTSSSLSTVRVLKGGVEVPAFVQALTPWRHVSDPSVDGQSIRVVRIQINNTF